MNEDMHKLWSKLDAQRGSQSIPELLAKALTQDDEIRVTPELLREVVKRHGAHHLGLYLTPPDLATFIAELSVKSNPRSVLDPTCGTGLMLKEVADRVKAEATHGIDVNQTATRVASRLLGKQATIFQGDTLHNDLPLRRAYDLIIADPPFGMRLQSPVTIDGYLTDYKDDFSAALACWICTKLAPNGRAILILPSSFLFSKQTEKARAAIAAAGFAFTACIQVPRGSFQGTSIEAQIAVLERSQLRDVFVGQYTTDEKHQRVLLDNLAARRDGKRLAQGRICPWDRFKGFTALESNERFKQLTERPGFHAVPMSRLVKATKKTRKSNFERLEHAPNCIYLPLAGPGTVTVHQDELSPRLKDYVQLQIDPEIADARFVAHLFNQELGRAILDMAVTGAVIKRVSLDALAKLDFYLPDRKIQEKVIESLNRISAIRSECREMEIALWADPTEINRLSKRVATINREDHYDDWIETLPFPLASILWRHKAATGSIQDRFAILLKFFEALAEFVATVHLSAFMSDNELWIEHKSGLDRAMQKQGAGWDHPTFGTWKCVLEYLGSKARKMMNQENKQCANLYRTRSRDVLAMLCSGDLFTILQTATNMRNRHGGHGGAIGSRQGEVIHNDLVELVRKCREVFGRTWLEYELVQPAESRLRGGIYHYKVRRMVGTRSMPFETVDRESIEGMEEDNLYLFDPSSDCGLRLKPFVRVMPSPRTEHNACYFYNRRDGDEARLISYHFEEDSDVTVNMADINATLEQLSIRDQNVGP